MKIFYTLLSFILFFGCKTAQDNTKEIEKDDSIHFYVGTYTKKAAKGIYKYKLSKKGVLERIGLVAETDNPSFLTKTIDNKTLLADGFFIDITRLDSRKRNNCKCFPIRKNK